MSDNEAATTEEEDAEANRSESESQEELESDSELDESEEAEEVSLIESIDEYQEHVEGRDSEQLASELETLCETVTEQRDAIAEHEATVAEHESTIEEHTETIEELESSLKRQQADFQNYKKRMEKRRKQERKRATEDLVTRLIDVRDNLQRGLEQDGDIREGVETTLSQFDGVLEAENVSEITPDPGDAVDPQYHEVLMRVESDQPTDTIDEVHRPGYEMAGKVLREAQVTVSEDTSEHDQQKSTSEDDRSDREDTE